MDDDEAPADTVEALKPLAQELLRAVGLAYGAVATARWLARHLPDRERCPTCEGKAATRGYTMCQTCLNLTREEWWEKLTPIPVPDFLVQDILPAWKWSRR